MEKFIQKAIEIAKLANGKTVYRPYAIYKEDHIERKYYTRLTTGSLYAFYTLTTDMMGFSFTTEIEATHAINEAVKSHDDYINHKKGNEVISLYTKILT